MGSLGCLQTENMLSMFLSMTLSTMTSNTTLPKKSTSSAGVFFGVEYNLLCFFLDE